MSKGLLLLIALGAACDAPVASVYLSEDTPRNREVVEEGVGMWGVAVEFVDRDSAVVEIEIKENNEAFELTDGKHRGMAKKGLLCEKSFWSVPKPFVVAHEFGHVYGLRHSDDHMNIMFSATHPEGDMDDAQLRKVQRRVVRCEDLNVHQAY